MLKPASGLRVPSALPDAATDLRDREPELRAVGSAGHCRGALREELAAEW